MSIQPPPTGTSPRDGLFRVDADGIVLRGRRLSFREAPPDGFSRKQIARLLGVNQFSVKRWEARYPELAEGRRAANPRVLRYEAIAIVNLADRLGKRVDTGAAIELGFPLAIIPSENIGFCEPRGRAGSLPVSSSLMAELLQAYEAWHAHLNVSGQTAALDGFVARPKLHPIQIDVEDLVGFVALGSSNISKTSAGRIAAASQFPAKHVEFKAAQAAAAVRDAARTPEGQGLLHLLLQLRRSRLLEGGNHQGTRGAA